MKLSKSDYLLFLKHPAWLWLKKHDPDRLPAIDDNSQAVFDSGFLFEAYAEKTFNNGVRLGFTDYDSYLALPTLTMETILSGAKTILQAGFETNQLTCICDVIQIIGDKTVDLYEVKSSTSVKPEHIPDLAFQVHVLQENGFQVRNIYVMHANNKYVRHGDVDPKELCSVTDISSKVISELAATKQHIQDALAVVQRPTMPDISPSLASSSSFSDWLSIYITLANLPKNSIYNLCGLNARKVKDLEDSGAVEISDIPEQFALSQKQSLQVQANKLNQPIITPEPIRQFVNSFAYPLYFLDYETLAGVSPPFDGTRSYQQIPFQYSLHILDSPDSELRSDGYLHRTNTNPCKQVAEKLRDHIGDSGTILAWNMGFEKSCNTTLAQAAPEHGDFLHRVNERMNDLMIPFAKGWYVDKDFMGSASIKKVLPVVVPTMSYAELGVRDGLSAKRLWMQAVIDGKDSIDKQVLFADLTEYCKLDTLAMVELFNVLRKI